MEFKRCVKCVMPNTRIGLTFNEDGVCHYCQNHEARKNVDWSERWLELEKVLHRFRKHDGSYDCMICVSGGKDSTMLVNLYRNQLAMHPVGFMIDNASWTETGRANFYNLSKEFDIDVLTYTPHLKTLLQQFRTDFVNELWAFKSWDSLLYSKPLEFAQKMGIGLVIWGEDTRWREIPNAKILVEGKDNYSDVTAIFTSYYIPWSRFENIEIAKRHGFKTLENVWERLGLEDYPYEQVDTIGYFVNQYCKFLKFGFSTITEIESDKIRHGLTTREEALQKVRENEWKLDIEIEKDFCEILGIDRSKLWDTFNQFANKTILEKKKGMWKMKEKFLI